MSATTLPFAWSEQPGKKLLTRQDCRKLVEQGLLTETYELIRGELQTKMGQNRPHSYTLNLVARWLRERFGEAYVQTQQPVDVAPEENAITEPEPDAVLLTVPWDTLLDRNPQPNEIKLLVEIANTTLRFDLTTKASVYAQAGILEYWVVDIAGRQIHCHRLPQEGMYRSVTHHGDSETLSLLTTPDTLVPVNTLLPPSLDLE